MNTAKNKKMTPSSPETRKLLPQSKITAEQLQSSPNSSSRPRPELVVVASLRHSSRKSSARVPKVIILQPEAMIICVICLGRCIHTYIHPSMHAYITLHYTTLRYTTLHYITLHYIAKHNMHTYIH